MKLKSIPGALAKIFSPSVSAPVRQLPGAITQPGGRQSAKEEVGAKLGVVSIDQPPTKAGAESSALDSDAAARSKSSAESASGATAEPDQEPTVGTIQTQQQEIGILSPAANLASLAASAHAISNRVDAILRAQGSLHGLADWALLKCLAQLESPQPMARVSLQLGVTRQSLQKQIEVFAEAKLVEVQAASGDKRGQRVMLTPQGRDCLSAIDSLWEAALDKSELRGKAENLDGLRRRLGRVSWLLRRMER